MFCVSSSPRHELVCSLWSWHLLIMLNSFTINIYSFIGCNKDIVFVLDASGGIGQTNFRHSVDFMRAIINGIDIGPHNSQVGLLVFSSHPQVQDCLDWRLTHQSTMFQLFQGEFLCSRIKPALTSEFLFGLWFTSPSTVMVMWRR